MELWHGSEVVVEHPSLDKCRQFNDYGRGFYCTPHEEMAMEWACRTESVTHNFFRKLTTA